MKVVKYVEQVLRSEIINDGHDDNSKFEFFECAGALNHFSMLR